MTRVIMVGLMVIGAAALARADKAAATTKEKTATPAAAAAGPPKPSPELVELEKYFHGTFKCTATWNASPFGPAHAATATATFKHDGAFWITNHYVEEKKGNAMAWDVTEMYTHDGKAFHRVGTDNFGGLVIGTAAKWEGDKLRFTGESNMQGGAKSPSAITFTKKGPKEIVYQLEMSGPDGKMLDLGGGTCKQ